MQLFINIEGTKYNINQIISVSPLEIISSIPFVTINFTNNTSIDLENDAALAVDRYFSDRRISRDLLPDEEIEAYQTYLDLGGKSDLQTWQAHKREFVCLSSLKMPDALQLTRINTIAKDLARTKL